MFSFSRGIALYAGGGSKSGSMESGTTFPSVLLDDIADETVVLGLGVDPSDCS
jgi:hypothetical protein